MNGSRAGGDGINQSTQLKRIAETNAYYGGTKPSGSRIFWVNGEVDPWHGLSVLESPADEQPVLMVDGASHHAWTHPSSPDDLPSIKAARAAIRQQVMQWLAAPATS